MRIDFERTFEKVGQITPPKAKSPLYGLFFEKINSEKISRFRDVRYKKKPLLKRGGKE